MKVLMINSTQNGLTLELFDEKNVYEENSLSNKHSEVILLGIDGLLKKANVSPKEVTHVAVCIGPGSFTGIRIAIAVAKAFAVANNTKLVAITTFDLFSYNVKDVDATIVRGFATFNYLQTKTVQDCLDEEDLKQSIKGLKNIVCEDLVAQMLEIKNYTLPNTKMFGVVMQKINKGEFVAPQNLDALYLRLSQAELTRAGKK